MSGYIEAQCGVAVGYNFRYIRLVKNTCIFRLICSMYYKYTSEWFVGLILRCIPFDITTQNELNKLKCVNTFVPTSCRVSCDLEIPL